MMTMLLDLLPWYVHIFSLLGSLDACFSDELPASEKLLILLRTLHVLCTALVHCHFCVLSDVTHGVCVFGVLNVHVTVSIVYY